jgi:4-hydroxyphenylpyruvate dioxygenase
MNENPLKLRKLHHVEFLVGNARQAAFFYRRAFGFSLKAYAGLETGLRQCASYALTQGCVDFVVSTPLLSDEVMSEHIKRHGDGVRDIAFEVEDADLAFEQAISFGAEPAIPPFTLSDKNGSVRRAAIRTYGDTLHSFLSMNDYNGPFLPGFESMPIQGRDAGILRVDHLVGNVELGKMQTWADWYSRVLGFRRYMSFDDKDIST